MVVANYGTPHNISTPWITLGGADPCRTVLECNPDYAVIWYGLQNAPSIVVETTTPTSLATDYDKFSVTYAGYPVAFAYLPVNGTPTSPIYSTNLTYAGFFNWTFPLQHVGTYTLKIYYRDADNASIPMETILLNYSVVASDGYTNEECNTTSSMSVAQPTTNIITDIFGNYKEMVWFGIMLLLGAFLLVISKGNMAIGVGVTAFAEILLLIIGAWFQIISPVYLLILGLIGCVVIALYMKKVFT
jgi:hypothetical protein